MNRNLSADPIFNIDDAYPTKFYKATDLDEGPLRLVICGFGNETVRGGDGADQLKPVLRFANTEKGVVLNVTNKEILKKSLGGRSADWMGASIEMYQTQVTFGGKVVPGIRMRVVATAPTRAAAPAANPEAENEMVF